MAYEGHIAGLGDRPPGKRLQGRAIEWLQSRSAARDPRRGGPRSWQPCRSWPTSSS